MPTPFHARSKLANTSRWHPDDHDAIAAARAELDAANAEQLTTKAIDKIVADAPTLTPEQAARLRALLPSPGR